MIQHRRVADGAARGDQADVGGAGRRIVGDAKLLGDCAAYISGTLHRVGAIPYIAIGDDLF
jgi:hypothetical protein